MSTDATDRLTAVYEQLGHSRREATALAINLLGAYGREYRPAVLDEAADGLALALTEAGASPGYLLAVRAAVRHLRSMADGTATGGVR